MADTIAKQRSLSKAFNGGALLLGDGMKLRGRLLKERPEPCFGILMEVRNSHAGPLASTKVVASWQPFWGHRCRDQTIMTLLSWGSRLVLKRGLNAPRSGSS